MFSMLRLAFTLLICLLAVGFYLGWFTFHKLPPDPQSNQVDINVTVDKNKVRSDLQTAERNLAKRIQDMNNQPQGNGQPAGQPPAPSLNLGPISVPPSGQRTPSTNGQPTTPSFSLGPLTVQPSGQPNSPYNQPAGPPQLRVQTQDYQFTVPLAPSPPPSGEGR
jgi:hypothetical protein